jgi:transposase-like protein
VTKLATDIAAHRYKRDRFPAHHLRRRSRGKLTMMVVSIKAKKYWLWRTVDADGYVLDDLLQSRRNRNAAVRLMRKLLKSQSLTLRVMVPDKLPSYSTAKAALIPDIEHRYKRASTIERRILTWLCDDGSGA